MISVCAAVHRLHVRPNIASIGASLAAALAGDEGELVVALNGVDAAAAGVPDTATAVDLEVNRGCAPGWNAAAQAARGDVLVFCNDDLELGAASVQRLAAALAEHPGAGVVGPLGSRWDLQAPRHVDWVDPAGLEAGRVLPCEVVSGFMFACHRATWEQVGGFDDFYAPASWEEVDFCTAVRAAGGECYAVAGVGYEHEWGVSRRQPPWARAHWDGRSETWRSIHRRNRRHFEEKWSEHPIASSPVAVR
jgi:GT2 family glycosyltransferase